jgi:hypothetical protein
MVSPNEMLGAAKICCLKGMDPSTKDDWTLVANFMAFNIRTGLEEPAMLLLRDIYDMPLTEEFIIGIAKFQKQSKERSGIK